MRHDAQQLQVNNDAVQCYMPARQWQNGRNEGEIQNSMAADQAFIAQLKQEQAAADKKRIDAAETQWSKPTLRGEHGGCIFS